MFKRLLKIGDSDKGDVVVGAASPYPSAGGRGEQNGRQSDSGNQDAAQSEGFLCPICMKSYSSPENLHLHFEAEHDQAASVREEGTGFICPMCKLTLSSAECLESHFRQAHEQNINQTLDQGSGFLCPVCKASLASPEDLQAHYKQAHSATSSFSETQGEWTNHVSLSTKGEDELAMYAQQLRASEESRTLLSSEVCLLREQLIEVTAVNDTMAKKKGHIEKKAAKLAGEMASAQARADESESQRAALEDHIITLKQQVYESTRYTTGLESQLAQRPGADDVLVLRKELIHAQTLMDQLSLVREKEKGKVEEECVSLEEKSKQNEIELLSLREKLEKAPRNEDLQRAECELSRLREKLEHSPRLEELERLQTTLSAQTSSGDRLSTSLGELQQTLRARDTKLAELDSTLHETQKVVEEKAAQGRLKDKQLAEMELRWSAAAGQLAASEARAAGLEARAAEGEEREGEREGERQREAAETGRRVEERERALAAAGEEVATLTAQLEEARQRDASVSQESVQQSTAVSQLQQQLQQSSQQLQQLAADHAAAQSQLKHADEQLAQLGSELERVEAAAAAVRSELDEARTTTAQTGSELATAQAGLRAKDEKMERRAVELADVTGQLESSAASNGAVQTQLDEALGRVREALQEGELQKTVRGELEAETQQLRETVLEREGQRSSLTTQLRSEQESQQAVLHEKLQQLNGLQLQLEQMTSEKSMKEAKVEELERTLESKKTLLADETHRSSEALSRLREMTVDLEESQHVGRDRETVNRELETALGERRGEVKRLKEESSELRAKIEAGEGVATAINQLEQENVALQQRLASSERDWSDRSEQQSATLEASRRELLASRSGAQAATDDRDRLAALLGESQRLHQAAALQLTQSEAQLKTKSELLMATELAKQKQRDDLESDLRTSQRSLEDSTAQLKQTKADLEKVRAEATEKTGKVGVLESKLREQSTQIQDSAQNISRLEATANKKDVAMEKLAAELAGQKRRFEEEMESGAERLVAVQTSLQAELAASRETLASTQASLQQELTASHDKLTSTQASLDEISGQLSSAQSRCQDVDNEREQLLEKLCSLEQKAELLRADVEQRSDDTRQMEKKNEELVAKLSDKDTSLEEMKVSTAKTRVDSEADVGRLKKEMELYSEQAEQTRLQLGQQLSVAEKLHENVVTENTQLETTLAENRAMLACRVEELAGTRTQLASLKEKHSIAESSLAEQCRRGDEKQQLCAKQQQQLEQQKVEISESNERSKQLADQVRGLESQCGVLTDRVSGLDQATATLRRQLEQADSDRSTAEVEQSRRIDSLTASMDDTEGQRRQLESQLMAAVAVREELEATLETSRKDFGKAEEKLSVQREELADSLARHEALAASLQDLTQIRESLDDDVAKTRSEVESLKADRTVLKEEKTGLECRLEVEGRRGRELSEQICSLEGRLDSLNGTLEAQQAARQTEVREWEDACTLLRCEAEQNASALGDHKARLQQLEVRSGEEKAEATQLQKLLREEHCSLQDKLTLVTQQNVDLSVECEAASGRYEAQLAALNENLGSLRAEWSEAEERSRTLQQANEELLAERLEVEAKLSNTHDERRTLLERCLESESECEKVREKTKEMRRKLDDTQAALQELGRENQTFQIKSNKNQNRFWADDTVVTNCEGCMKVFSVTIRKHHCRVCGHIFCQECSSKTAQLTSSKKPLRVCDNCYHEQVQ